jgi:hypothetical protein
MGPGARHTSQMWANKDACLVCSGLMSLAKSTGQLHAWSLLLSQSPRACRRDRKMSTTSAVFARSPTTLPRPCSAHCTFTNDLLHETIACVLVHHCLLLKLSVGFGTHEQSWMQVIQLLSYEEEMVAPTSLQCPPKKSGTSIVTRSAGSILWRISL